MHKTVLFIIVIALLAANVLFVGCDTENRNKVVIKGKIENSSKSGQEKSLTLSDATKVLVFNGLKLDNGACELDMSFVNIEDGAFTTNVDMGQAAALIFLNSTNQYIGTLAIRGLFVLPLGNLSDGENTVIDLSTLTLDGTIVIPEHDPVGNEIILSEADLNTLKEVDSFFESLAKNLDCDNDGALDMLSDKQFFIKSVFDIKAGTFGIDNIEPVISDTALDNINYSIHIYGGEGFTTPPSTFLLTGPEIEPYDDIDGYDNIGGTVGVGFGFGLGFNRHTNPYRFPFKQGTYTLTLDGNAYTFDYSNIDAKYNLVFATPTLHTNSDGKLVSISLVYQNSNYIPISPENVLTVVQIQLSAYQSSSPFYSSPQMSNVFQGHDDLAGISSLTLDAPLDITTLYSVGVLYRDILGNSYFINWNSP